MFILLKFVEFIRFLMIYLALNEYVVTNQWGYPTVADGKRLDIVLLINGFPVVISELKTPVRDAISWLDAAGDIAAYEKKYSTNVCS